MSNLTVLNVDDFLKAVQAQEVTDDAIVTAKGKFSPGGLFSETIFGLDRSKDRGKTYGFISLNTVILHPFIYDIMKKMEVRVTELIDGDTMYYDEDKKVLYKDLKKEYKGDPNENTNLKEISGYDGAMYAILKGIDYRGGNELRDKLVTKLKEVIADGSAFIDKVVVIPPNYRNITIADDGRLESMDDINTLYVKLLSYAKKIKATGSSNDRTTGVMSDNALIRKQIQSFANDLFLLGKSKIGKKYGLVRGQLLGKRVDYSARSAVSAGYDIPAGKIGVPYRMIANVAQPFLIHHFAKELIPESEDYNHMCDILERNGFDRSNNVVVITSWLKDVSENKCNMSPDDEKWLMEEFQTAVGDKYVLMKRDPSIHRSSWQSYKPIVISGNAMRVPIIQTGAHNMDYDGRPLKPAPLADFSHR